jgi:hypothetical protein
MYKDSKNIRETYTIRTVVFHHSTNSFPLEGYPKSRKSSSDERDSTPLEGRSVLPARVNTAWSNTSRSSPNG